MSATLSHVLAVLPIEQMFKQWRGAGCLGIAKRPGVRLRLCRSALLGHPSPRQINHHWRSAETTAFYSRGKQPQAAPNTPHDFFPRWEMQPECPTREKN